MVEKKKKLTKEDIEGAIEDDPTNVPEDIRNFVQIYKEFAECAAGQELPDGFIPTSGDIQKMATSVYIERNKTGRTSGYSEPKPVNRDSTTVRTMEPKAVTKGGGASDSLECPECGDTVHVKYGKKPYYRCDNKNNHKSGTALWLNLSKDGETVRTSPVK